MEAILTFKRDRPVNNKDRYFIVMVQMNGTPIPGEVGYIEKEFIESEFIKKIPL